MVLGVRREGLPFVITAALLTAMAGEAHADDAGLPNMLPLPEGDVVLEVHGEIGNGNRDGIAVFDAAMLRALLPASLETSTAVTDGVRRFDGFLMRDLLERIDAAGTSVLATALNDYSIEISVDEFHKFDVLVAYEMDGEALLPSDKGPLWIVYPRDDHPELQDIRYDYRWVWQLTRLDVR